MSQEDVDRLDEKEVTAEDQDDDSPDAEGHRFLGAERAMDPNETRAHDAERAS